MKKCLDKKNFVCWGFFHLIFFTSFLFSPSFLTTFSYELIFINLNDSFSFIWIFPLTEIIVKQLLNFFISFYIKSSIKLKFPFGYFLYTHVFYTNRVLCVVRENCIILFFVTNPPPMIEKKCETFNLNLFSSSNLHQSGRKNEYDEITAYVGRIQKYSQYQRWIWYFFLFFSIQIKM